jgi:hypothetical protein
MNAPWKHRETSPALAIKAGGQIIPFHAVARLDAARIDRLEMTIHLIDGSSVEALGFEALEIAMMVKPSVLEGRRMGWGQARMDDS